MDRLIRHAAIAALAAMLVTITAASARADAPMVGKVKVTDGDTIKIGVRLIGFDTPETGRKAKCAKERELGEKAKARLKEILATGRPSIELVECECAAGSLGKPQCNFGRACGKLFVDGQDVSGTMIAEGLARPYACSRGACPARGEWCAVN